MELRSFDAMFLTQWRKTGGSASPILFSIYIDILLQKLKGSGLGCHMGRTSPSHSGLRQMIQMCEQYAMDNSIVFNPVNSTLMCFNSVSSVKPYYTLCGKTVDVVYHDLHVGNCIYNNMYTQSSNSMISDFYRRGNQVKSSFRMCDSFTLKSICILLFVTVLMALNYITLIRHP